jgi:hypothetical protein
VFMTDGGGGGTAPAPDYSGTQTLNVEPESIPGARDAFREARDRVQAELDKLNHLEVREWATDPVSAQAVARFTERTSTEAESAREVLTGYLQQLDRAVDALDKAYQYYVETEGTNAALWGKGK